MNERACTPMAISKGHPPTRPSRARHGAQNLLARALRARQTIHPAQLRPPGQGIPAQPTPLIGRVEKLSNWQACFDEMGSGKIVKGVLKPGTV